MQAGNPGVVLEQIVDTSNQRAHKLVVGKDRIQAAKVEPPMVRTTGFCTNFVVTLHQHGPFARPCRDFRRGEARDTCAYDGKVKVLRHALPAPWSRMRQSDPPVGYQARRLSADIHGADTKFPCSRVRLSCTK